MNRRALGAVVAVLLAGMPLAPALAQQAPAATPAPPQVPLPASQVPAGLRPAEQSGARPAGAPVAAAAPVLPAVATPAAPPLANIRAVQLRKQGETLNLGFVLSMPSATDVVANLPKRVIVVKFRHARAAFPDGQTVFAFNDPLVVGISFDAIDENTTWAKIRLRIPDVLYQLTSEPGASLAVLSLKASPTPLAAELYAVQAASGAADTRVQVELSRPSDFEDRFEHGEYLLRLKGVVPRLRSVPHIDDARIRLLDTKQDGPDTVLRFELKGQTRVTTLSLSNPPRLEFNFRPSGPQVAKAAPLPRTPGQGPKQEDLKALLEAEPDLVVRGNYLAAERELAAGNLDVAERLFLAIFQAVPDHKLGVRAYFRAADALFARLQAAHAHSYDTAIIRYQAAMRAADAIHYDSDQIPRAFYQIGRGYQLMGFNFESNTNFQLLQERFPESQPYVADADYYEGINYLALGMDDDAILHLRRFLEGPGSTELVGQAHYELGDALYNGQQFVQARQEFDQGRKLAPQLPATRPLLLFHMGETYYENADFDSARVMYRQLLDRYPDKIYSKLVGLRLGDFLRDEGKEEEAVATYRQVLENAPLEIALRAQMRIASVLANHPVGDDWKKGIALYDQVIASGGDRPIVPEAQLRKALTLTLHNQQREAIQAFETLVQKYPKSPFVRDNLVKANIEENLKSLLDQLFQQKAYWDVVRVYAQYQDNYLMDFPFAFARFEVARSYQTLELYDTSVRQYDKLLKDNLGSLRLLVQYQRAVALADQGNLPAAATAFQQIIAGSPEDPYRVDARLRLGGVFSASRKYQEAHQVYADLITDIGEAKTGELVEAAPEVYYRQALINKELGQKTEALQDYRQAVARFNYPLQGPEVPEFIVLSQFAQGDLLADLGQNPQALEAYQQAIARYPNHEQAPWARYEMGLVYRRMGDDQRALEVFQGLEEEAKTRPGELWATLAQQNRQDLADKLQYQKYLQQ